MSCELNKAVNCTCTYSCSKHGKCCECIAYHNRAGELPACVFSPDMEKTYDRSVGALVRDRRK